MTSPNGSTTTHWTYDDAGNILKREVYPYGQDSDPSAKISEVIYTYGDDKGWGDLLTSYNGVPITYDGIGNPLNDGTWTYTWQHGRQLASMSRTGTSEQWQYSYNADGLRTQRTNGTTTYQYTYLGSQLTHMTVAGHTMYFAYDASGVPMTLTDNGVTYYYVTNLQGDVIAILNSSCEEVVRYTYDAWGNLRSVTGTMANTLGYNNPLRYRGYVYDQETRLYYLQSRYYNPEIGRFINADGLVSTGQGLLGNNMFSYCGNNPVNLSDPSGYFPTWLQETLNWVKNHTIQPLANRYKLSVDQLSLPPKESTFSEKAKQVAKSVWNNLELSVGAGFGFYYEGTAYDLLDFGIGMYGTSGTFYLSEGNWYCGQEFNISAYGGLFGHNFGYNYYSLTPYEEVVVPIESKFFFNDDTWTISSGSIYFIGGGSYRVGFDIVQFIYDIDGIFE